MFISPKLIKKIDGSEEAGRINDSLGRAVRYQLKSEVGLELFLFKLEDWVAVPLLSQFLIDLSSRESFQNALLEEGYSELYCVVLDTDRPLEYTYKIDTDQESLDEFCRRFGSYYFVIFTGELRPDWIIVSIESDCYILAGPSDLISRLISCNIETAFSSFWNFANPEPQLSSKYFNFLYDQLKNKYPYVEAGSVIALDNSNFP